MSHFFAEVDAKLRALGLHPPSPGASIPGDPPHLAAILKAAQARNLAADGMGERKAALGMLDTVPGMQAKSLGADKVYDTQDSSPPAEAATSRLMSPAMTPGGAAAQSMGAPRVAPLMPEVRHFASASKGILAGARQWVASDRPCTEECGVSISTSN